MLLLGLQWAMVHLDKSLVGNQNSIPRELVYDVNEVDYSTDWLIQLGG